MGSDFCGRGFGSFETLFGVADSVRPGPTEVPRSSWRPPPLKPLSGPFLSFDLSEWLSEWPCTLSGAVWPRGFVGRSDFLCFGFVCEWCDFRRSGSCSGRTGFVECSITSPSPPPICGEVSCFSIGWIRRGPSVPFSGSPKSELLTFSGLAEPSSVSASLPSEPPSSSVPGSTSGSKTSPSGSVSGR